jgi:hypothetical protein
LGSKIKSRKLQQIDFFTSSSPRTSQNLTDQEISGYDQAESAKPNLKPMILFYKSYLIGEVIMLKIRRMGAFSRARPAGLFLHFKYSRK